ncbi:MAG: hypothetical protein KJO54_04045 [Gammaproteobacteria bacterium]|nr:hypothetical protein [Gammaproteobacteria bacterium]NNF61153.1 hypothetical protein [Gammaproteobacteria bacterium]NNM19757.1 hypothetical protein [Gammaproteobacteria bacterium]
MRRALLALLLFVLPLTGTAGEVKPLFASDEPLQVTIEAPLRGLARDTDPAPEYRPAKFSFVDAAGVQQSFDIGIRPRGKNRRKKEVCDHPPLRLNFRGGQVKDTLFDNQDKLKLVVRCRRGASFEQYVLQEYLVYRLYNLLTEHSFRVRLLDVTFIESGGKGKPRTSPAFIIEDRRHMAKRGGYKYRTPESIQRFELDESSSTLLGVFQYFIGNTDWSMLSGPDDHCCHNSVLIAEKNKEPYIPVPYDFDYSGIIDTPYAVPAKSAKVKTVRQRAYRGFCKPQPVLDKALDRFREQKQAIYDLYNNQPGLSSGTLKKTIRYLDEFYATIDEPKKLEKYIVGRCR